MGNRAGKQLAMRLTAQAVSWRENMKGKERKNMYPTIDMKATGRRLRQIMEQRKISVMDVKQYLNLSSVQSIYRWFWGKSMPTIDHLYALSELFGLPIDELIIGSRKYMPSGENMVIGYDGRIHDVLFLTRMWTYYQWVIKMLYFSHPVKSNPFSDTQ